MKYKQRCLGLLFIALLFSSCFNNLKISKDASVSFSLDEAAVKQIVDSARKVPAYSKIFSSRAAEEEEAETSQLFIDVTLCADVDQTKTLPLTKEVKVEFDKIPVNTKVYAKAEVYAYTDSSQSQKEVFYRGQSKTITVRDTSNALTIKMAAALLTVTFETNGGSELAPVTVKTGDSVEEPEKPLKPAGKKKYSRENFAFAGWYTDAELTQAYNFALPVKNDLTLYAKWLPDFVFVEGATVENYLAAGRNVRISDLFVSDHEVTQAEYYALTKEAPSQNKAGSAESSDFPVENVSWFDAIEYCNKLSKKEGLNPCYTINGDNVSCSLSANGYRLPTEAEWEYIAGKALRTNTDFSNIAYTAANSGNKTHPVKYSLADELSLCDIFGNVAEWCYDIYSASIANSTGPTGPMASGSVSRVVRGGSYLTDASQCKPDQRKGASPSDKSSEIGFRLVRSDINEYKIIKNTVTFKTNGGSNVDIQSVVDGESALQPADPTRTGYEFKGWIYDGAAFDFSTPITMDIVVEAKWQPITYTISYDLDGGTETTANPTSYTIETETIVLNNPEKTDYNFKGWFNGTEKVNKIEKGSYGNLDLVARWTQCHIVSFDLQDGSTPTEQEVENNSTATEPAEPSRTGFTFVRWYDATGSDDDDFDFTTPITGNVSLKALWQYKVTYDSSSGTAVNAQTYKQTEAVTAPTAPTRTGFTFDCWCEDSADGPEYTFGNVSSTGNITLYARWKYTVTYDSNGGSAVSGMTSIHTVPISEPEEPTWWGYIFDGWYSDSDLTTAFTFGSPPENGDITLYARWKYYVTFNTDGGTFVPQQTPIHTQPPTLPDPAPTKENFEFEYWCTNLSDPENTKYEFDSPLAGVTTLHAKFKAIEENLGTITVTFGIATGDLDVRTEETGTTVKYTLNTAGGFTSYYWEFDGTAQASTTNILTLDKSSLPIGVFDVYLEAVKDDVTYSWSQQITITE